MSLITLNYVYKILLMTRYGKETKFTNRVTKHLNIYKSHIYPKTPQKIQQKYYKKNNILSRN